MLMSMKKSYEIVVDILSIYIRINVFVSYNFLFKKRLKSYFTSYNIFKALIFYLHRFKNFAGIDAPG
jgi:hypothetical protein